MALLAASYAAGILICASEGLLGLLLTAVASAFVWLFGPRNWRSAILVFAITAVIGSMRYYICSSIPGTDISRLAGKVTSFSGTVVSEPEVKSGKIRFLVKCFAACEEGRKRWTTGQVLVSSSRQAVGPYFQVDYGDRLCVKAKIYSPRKPSNPGEFSYKDFLARKGVFCQAWVRDPQQISITGHRTGNLLIALGGRIRQEISDSIFDMFPNEEAAVIAGMVLGSYAYLPEDVYTNFTRTGTMHLLAASGYNCFILVFFLFQILRDLKIASKTRNAITILFIGLYVLVVGAAPSIIRAGIMCCIALLALPLGRVANLKNTFFVAMAIILAVRPTDIFDIGFQLSFMAIAALIWINPIAETMLNLRGLPVQMKISQFSMVSLATKSLRRTLVETLVSTVTVTVATAPIIAQYFNYASRVAIPCNILMALTVPPMFVAGLTAPIISHIPLASTIVGIVGLWITKASLFAISWAGSRNWASVSIQSPGVISLVLYYTALTVTLVIVRRKLDKNM